MAEIELHIPTLKYLLSHGRKREKIEEENEENEERRSMMCFRFCNLIKTTSVRRYSLLDSSLFTSCLTIGVKLKLKLKWQTVLSVTLLSYFQLAFFSLT